MRGSFEAAHRLRGDFGPATRLHGHTYQVEVIARGNSLNADGILLDVGLLRRLLDAALGKLRHRDLDEIAAFRDQNTTAEVVARHLFVELRQGLGTPERVESLQVRVWESPEVYAGFEGPLGRSAEDD